MIPASLSAWIDSRLMSMAYGDLVIGLVVIASQGVFAGWGIWSAGAWACRKWSKRRTRRRARQPWLIPYDRREELSIAAPLIVTLVLSALFLGAIVSCWRAIP